MKHTIDCFVAHANDAQGTTLSQTLEAQPTVHEVSFLRPDADDVPDANAPFIPLERGLSTASLKAISQLCTSEYVLFYTHATALTLGYRALERMMAVADDTHSAMVYSHRYLLRNGETLKAPVNSYQLGSVRDDFDFGPLWLVRADALRRFIATQPTMVQYAGLYQLRLYLSRVGHLTAIDEYLYTETEVDLRSSGEKQFDYVDPRNQAIQQEMEQVCTAHLKAIKCLIYPKRLHSIDFGKEAFDTEATVIIPVRNRVRTIGDAIESVLSQQTNFAFNLIIVNNHSTDGTTERIDEYARTDKRILHLIPEQEDLGIGGCWDMAIRHPQCGRFCIQLDSDDLYAGPDTLQRIIDTFHREHCGMVIGSYSLCNFALETLPPGLIAHREWTAENGMNNALRINGLGAPRAFYTPLIRSIGFPNVSYGEDYAVALAITREHTLGRIYDSLYLCRRWEGNSDAALSPERVAANNRYKDSIRTQEILARQALIKA